MCRHIGYIGKERLLSDIFLNKSHSIIDMAFRPKEMENAKLNADGFGIGWNTNNFLPGSYTASVFDIKHIQTKSTNKDIPPSCFG